MSWPRLSPVQWLLVVLLFPVALWKTVFGPELKPRIRDLEAARRRRIRKAIAAFRAAGGDMNDPRVAKLLKKFPAARRWG